MDYLNRFGSLPQPPRLRSLQAAADSPNHGNNVMLSAAAAAVAAARAASSPCRSSSAARASADALDYLDRSPSCGTEPDQFYDAPDAFQPATKPPPGEPPPAQHRYASRGSRLGNRIAAFSLDNGSSVATAATAAAAAATGSALPAEWLTRGTAAVVAVARGPALNPDSAADNCVPQMQQESGGANGRPSCRRYAGDGIRDGVGNGNGDGGGLRRDGSGVPVRPGCGGPTTEASPMVDSVLLAGRVGELRTLGQELVARLMKVQEAKAHLYHMEEVLQEELQAVRQAVADELERLRIQEQRMASDGAAKVAPSSDDAAAAAGTAAVVIHNDVSSQLASPLGGAATRMSSYSEAALASLSASPSYINESGASHRGQRSTARQSSEPSAANSDAPASPQLQPQQPSLLPPQLQQPIPTAPQGLSQAEPNAQMDPRLSSLSAVQLLQAALARAASASQPAPSGDGQEAQLLTALSQLLQSPRPAVPEFGRPGLAPAPAPVPAPLLRMDAVAPSIDELYGKAAMAAATAAEAAAYVAPALDYAVQLMQEAAARSGRPPRLADYQAPGRPLLPQAASTAQSGMLDGTEQVDRRLAAVTAAAAEAVARGYVGDGGLRGWPGVKPGTEQRSAGPEPAATGWQQRAVASGPSGLEPTAGGPELQALLRLLGLHEQQEALQRLQAPWEQQQEQQQEQHSLPAAGTFASQPRMAAGTSRDTSPLPPSDVPGYQQQQVPQRLLPPWLQQQQQERQQEHQKQLQQQQPQTPRHDDPWVGPPSAAGAQMSRPGGPWTAGAEQALVGVQAGAEPGPKRRRVAAGHGS